MTVSADVVRANVASVRERMASAAKRAGRGAAEVRLVAITKTVPVETIRMAVAAGIGEAGENRIQEAAGKIPLLPSDMIWHMVGRVQTNKSREAVSRFAMVHSLDRLRLAESLNRAAENVGSPCRVLVQVNVSGAETQGGVDPREIDDFIEKCLGLPYLRMCGLMAIGPFPAGEAEIRTAYRGVRNLFHRLASRAGPDFVTLSLGMSGDFEIAIEEGSTLVRVGTAIFGKRR